MRLSRVLWVVLLPVMVWGQPQGPNLLWIRSYGDTARFFGGGGVVPTADDGCLLVGSSSATHVGPFDAVAIKLNNSGTVQWSRRYQIPGETYYPMAALGVTNGFALACYKGVLDGIGILRIDTSGNLLWARGYPYDRMGFPAAMAALPNGNFAIAGRAAPMYPYIETTGFLMKLNAEGDTAWIKLYHPGLRMAASVTDMKPTADGGFVLAGTVYGEDNSGNPVPTAALLIRTDAQGDTLWMRRYFSPFGDHSGGERVAVTSDNGFVLIGHWASDNEYGEWVVRTGPDGDTLWTRTLPVGDLADVLVTPQGGIILAAMGEETIPQALTLCRLSADGSELTWRTESVSEVVMHPASLVSFVDGGYGLGGTGDYFRSQMLLGRFAPDIEGTGREEWRSQPAEMALYQNYPNPFNSSTEISFVLTRAERVVLKVHDLLGKEVATLVDQRMEAGEQRVTFNGTGLSSGIYFCRLETAGVSQTRKMVLLK